MLLQALCIISYPLVILNLSYSPETPNLGHKFDDFFSRVTLNFDGWPSKTIGHLFYATSSFVQHFIAIGEFKLELQSRNPQSGSNSAILAPCDLEIWRMTLKNNRSDDRHILSIVLCIVLTPNFKQIYNINNITCFCVIWHKKRSWQLQI